MLSTQKLATLFALFTTTQAAKCPYGFGKGSESKPLNLNQVSDAAAAKYPSDVLTCSKGAGLKTAKDFSSKDYDDIVKTIVEMFDKEPDVAEPNHNPRATFAGSLVRLAGHDFMDW